VTNTAVCACRLLVISMWRLGSVAHGLTELLPHLQLVQGVKKILSVGGLSQGQMSWLATKASQRYRAAPTSRTMGVRRAPRHVGTACVLDVHTRHDTELSARVTGESGQLKRFRE
jgi:hypothetical protein